MLLTLLSCYKLNRCYIKLSLVNILEMVFVFIEILFKMLLFKGGVLIYAEHCIYMYMCVCVCVCVCVYIHTHIHIYICIHSPATLLDTPVQLLANINC